MADPQTSIGGLLPVRRAPTTAPVRPTGLVPIGTPFAAKPRQPVTRDQAVEQALANPNLPAWARDAIANPSHRRSIGKQIGGVFGGLIPGAIHFAKDAATDVGNLIPGALQTLHHHGLGGGAAPELGRRAHALQATGVDPGPSVNTAHMFPLATQTGKSFEQTAGRLAQLGPVEVRSVGGEPITTYGDAYRQGDIINTVLGDALNVSMAAGAAGVGLRGVGMERAADVAGVVSRAGGRAANAPMEAVGGVLGGAKSLWREGGQSLKEGIYSRLPEDSALGRRLVRSSTPEGRLLKEASVKTRSEPGKFGNWMATNLAKDAGATGETRLFSTKAPADAPNLIEQEVGLARVSGVAQADRLLSDQLGPQASLAAHVPEVRPGETLTPEGQAMAHAYEAGMLPAEQMARIDRVSEAYRKQAGILTERATAGHGQKPLDPAQTGDLPLTDQVQIRLAEAGMRPDDVAALTDLVDQGASWESLAPLAPELGNILHDPQVYPAPWRESMNVMAQGAKAGAIVPRTPQEMIAAGLERPTYMPGTASTLENPRAPSKVPITEGFGGIRSVAAEHHRATLGHGPYSLATAAEGLKRAAATTEFNHILHGYLQRAEIPDATRILAKPADSGQIADWADLADRAAQRVEASNTGSMSPQLISQRTQQEFGKLVLDELHQRGYDVLNGDRAAPKPGDFNPDEPVDLMNVGPNSIVLPRVLKDRLVPYKIGTDHNMLIALNSKGNAWFKRNVLPLNLHWTLGDMTSNLIMAWRSGAVNPIEMFKAGRALKKLDPAAAEQMFNRPEFVDAGLKYQAAQALNPLASLRKPARTPFGKVIRPVQDFGFRLNKVANRLQRHEYVYAKLTKELQARGLASTIEDLGADPAAWKAPAVQKAISDVVNDGNNVLGTWEEMSPLEQRVATQIFPFWSWVRHITSLVARTSVDNPTRVLWTLRVGALGMNTSPQDMPDFMRGSIPNPFGDGRINMNWANPFYDVGSGGLASPGAATRSLSPLIKFGITAATNRDPARDLNIVSHRPGTSPSRFTSALYGALGASPFIRGAMNLSPEVTVPGVGLGLGPVRRYGSGQPIIDKTTGQEASAGQRWRMAANMVNAPLPTSYVPTQPAPSTIKPRKAGLKRAGLTGGLKHVGLKHG